MEPIYFFFVCFVILILLLLLLLLRSASDCEVARASNLFGAAHTIYLNQKIIYSD